MISLVMFFCQKDPRKKFVDGHCDKDMQTGCTSHIIRETDYLNFVHKKAVQACCTKSPQFQYDWTNRIGTYAEDVKQENSVSRCLFII